MDGQFDLVCSVPVSNYAPNHTQVALIDSLIQLKGYELASNASSRQWLLLLQPSFLAKAEEKGRVEGRVAMLEVCR